MPTVSDAAFVESDHPRDEDGKFGSGGGVAPGGDWKTSHQAKKGRVELVPLSYLKSIAGNPTNVEASSPGRIAAVKKSISESGLQHPIEIHADLESGDHDGPVVTVAEGNHRVEALSQLGYTHAPAFVQRQMLSANSGGKLHKIAQPKGIGENHEFVVFGGAKPSDLGIKESASRNDSLAGERTDHETAEAIRDGLLPSPTAYGNFWLFDLRITGTGASYRAGLDEYVVRDPAIWLSPAFLERCNGLAVVFEHPPDGLNHEEWERAVGTVVLPYIKDDEVRGVAKIFDADAAALMQSTHKSTSPGITTPKGSDLVVTESGARVLVEDLPLIMDHVAICERGVWDKDGPANGVRLDSDTRKVESSVAKLAEDEKDLDRSDADKRWDAMTAEQRADAFKRMDASEEDKDGDKDEDKDKDKSEEKDDSEESEDDKKDPDDKDDAAGEEPADERGTKKFDKKDTAVDVDKAIVLDSATVARMRKEHRDEIKRLESSHDKRYSSLEKRLERISTPLGADERNAIAKTWNDAATLYAGLGNPNTPEIMQGESHRSYRRRLAMDLRQYAETPTLKTITINDSTDDAMFDILFDKLVAEAKTAVSDPVRNDAAKGGLRAVERKWNDKTVTEYVGNPEGSWREFEPSQMILVRGLGLRNAV